MIFKAWIFLVIIGTFIFISPIMADVQYLIDREHTSIEFEIEHLMLSSVKGRFDEFEGRVILNEDKSQLKAIRGSVKSSSINTNQKKRDDHLKSPDFFDSKKFPKLEFEANDLSLNKGKKSKVKGFMSIRGIRQEVEISLHFKGIVKDPWGTEKVVLVAETEINRKDYGLTWNEALEAGGVMIGEEVKIRIDAQANKNNPKGSK